jgi:hypothetical protein
MNLMMDDGRCFVGNDYTRTEFLLLQFAVEADRGETREI